MATTGNVYEIKADTVVRKGHVYEIKVTTDPPTNLWFASGGEWVPVTVKHS